MRNFTLEKCAPKAESLLFIRTFARFYSPQEDNEREARLAAQTVVAAMRTEC